MKVCKHNWQDDDAQVLLCDKCGLSDFDVELNTLKEQLKVAEQERSELQSRAESLERLVARYEGALKRISQAKPDRLDHEIDVTIIERAARIAKDALSARVSDSEQALEGKEI